MKDKKNQQIKIEELEKKVFDLEDQLKRAVADYQNLEKRTEEQKREIVRFANKELLLQLLPAFDTLFLADQYIQDEGLKLSIKKLLEVFKNTGVERIETEGKDFNPAFMECVDTQHGEENKVIAEVRPGFTLFGHVLRAAQVKVSKKKVEEKEEEEAKQELLKGDYM